MAIGMIMDKNTWDDFVDKSFYGLLFHKWDFLKIVEKHSRYKFLPYAIYRGDELACIFPLFYKREVGVRSIFSPPPHASIPYLGMVMYPMYDTMKQKRKESCLCSSIDEINHEIMKMSPNYVSIYLPPGFKDMRPFKWHDYVADAHYTYKLDLTAPLNDIWKGFDATCRKNIKRSERLKPVIKQVSDVEKFYGVMEKRYEVQGLNLPIFSPQYLADLLVAFPDNIKMYFIYHGDDIIALCINCEYKNVVTHWLGAAKFDNGIAGNDYLLWELIKIAKASGFTEFEIQGANQKRLSQFKSKFNPDLEVYYSIEKRDNIGKLAEWAYIKIARKKALNF